MADGRTGGRADGWTGWQADQSSGGIVASKYAEGGNGRHV